MKKLSLKQQFVRFLMTHGALKKFYRNCAKSTTPLHDYPKMWIAWAFDCIKSDEGYAYWHRLHNLWDLHLKELENVKTITLCGVKWLVENEVKIDGNKYFTADEAILHLKGTGRRLPTKIDFENLHTLPNCWDEALKGRWFAENEKDLKDPEKSLFLPAMGFRKMDGSLGNVGSYGYYWSNEGNNINAYGLAFTCSFVYSAYHYLRKNDFSMRSILNK